MHWLPESFNVNHSLHRGVLEQNQYVHIQYVSIFWECYHSRQMSPPDFKGARNRCCWEISKEAFCELFALIIFRILLGCNTWALTLRKNISKVNTSSIYMTFKVNYLIRLEAEVPNFDWLRFGDWESRDNWLDMFFAACVWGVWQWTVGNGWTQWLRGGACHVLQVDAVSIERKELSACAYNAVADWTSRLALYSRLVIDLSLIRR